MATISILEVVAFNKGVKMIYSPVIAASAASHHHIKHYGDIEKINDIEYSGSYLKCTQQQDNSLICGEYYKPAPPMTKTEACLTVAFCIAFILFMACMLRMACSLGDSLASLYIPITIKNKEDKELK